MPWYQTWDGKYVNQTSQEEWAKCMGDDRVITLEDLSAGWDAGTAILSTKTSESPDSQALYNLRGQRVKHTGKGIYIKDGKKIIIR